MRPSRTEISKQEKGCPNLKTDGRVLLLLEKSRLDAAEVCEIQPNTNLQAEERLPQ